MQSEDYSLIKASDIMTTQVLTTGENCTILEAVKKMSALNVGAIVVTDNAKKPVGIFTERDLMNRVIVKGIDPGATTMALVMTKDPKTLASDTLISDVVQFSQRERVRHIILADNNVLTGIISIREVNKLLIETITKAHKELKESTVRFMAGKLDALGDLTAGVAHELNQPLNVMKIICQSILRDIDKGRFSEAEAKENLPEIVKQINKMADIIGHMRIFTRRGDDILLEAHDISKLVQDTIKFIGQQLKTHKITLVEKLETGLPPVMADYGRFEQVCLNLINNARYAVEKTGKKEMKIEVKTSLSADGREVLFEVIDNGVGIPDEVKPKIFQPFYTTKEPEKGTGLGLCICHKIIKEHKGKIEFESKPGDGTVFRVSLPINK